MELIKKNYNQSIANALFLCGFFIVLAHDLFIRLDCYAIIADYRVGLIGHALLGIKVLYDVLQNQISRDKIAFYMLGLCGVATYCLTHQSQVLLFAVTLLAACGISYKKILSLYVRVVGILFSINLLLVAIGMKAQKISYDVDAGHSAEARYSLGTWGYNMPLVLCVFFVFAVVILYAEQLKGIAYLALYIIGCAIYCFTDQRGAMLALTATILLLLVFRISPFASLINRYTVTGLYLLQLIALLGVGYLADGERFTDNAFVSTLVSRLVAFGVCRQKIGFSFFGKSLEGLDYPVDVLAYNLFFSCGAIGVVIISWIIIKAIYSENADIYFLIVMIGNIIFWVFEAMIFSSVDMVTLLAAGAACTQDTLDEAEADTASEEMPNRLIQLIRQNYMRIMLICLVIMFVGRVVLDK